ncbi:MAG: carboxypeptidase M32, partial [Planctomycetaceae bacterium]|nr:carboxypeptidase M32 [Planctomycetaceae bacterium]
AQFARGDFAPLREWLGSNIHSRGQLYRPDRLLEKVTGQKLSHEPLVRHLRGKFGAIYDIA